MEKTVRSVDAPVIAPRSPWFRFFSFIFYYDVLCLLHLVFPLLYSIRVRGKEHLQGIRHAVIISNHCHYLDPGFAAYAVSPVRLCFTGLEQTFVDSSKPFILLIRLLGGIPIPDAQPWSILPYLREVASSEHRRFIHIFPEGEMIRSNSTLRPFKPGAFIVAAECKVPVIPMVASFQQRRFWFPRLTVEFLEPIDAAAVWEAGGSRRKASIRTLAADVRRRMQQAVHTLQAGA